MTHQLLWKPLLAATLPLDYDLRLIPYPVYASPKIDGFRMMVQNAVCVSRNGRPIPNAGVQAKWGRKEFEGLDGELTDGAPYGADVFNKASRLATKRTADASAARFNVFGYYSDHDQDFADRLSWLTKKDRGFAVVQQVLIKNPKELELYKGTRLKMGYEGVMLVKSTSGPYPQKPGKSNRSTLAEFDLVKLKDFDYGEAKIMAVYPLEHNKNTDRTSTGKRSSKKDGMVRDASRIGSTTLRDVKSKVEFQVSVADEIMRTWHGWSKPFLWRGVKVRYKFFPTGNVKAPRFPTCEFKELL